MSTAQQSGPKVTLALFAYNQETWVTAAANSCLAQTFEPLEIILSDDASTDQTFDCLRRVAADYQGPHQVRLNRNERNLGFIDHFNRVVAMAKGDIIVVAAGDDLCLPRKVELLVEEMLRDPAVVAAHSAVIEIDRDGAVIGVAEAPNHEHINDPWFITQRLACVAGAAHAFRKSEVFDRFGPLRSDVFSEDVALPFREALMGRITYVREPTTQYRKGVGVATEQELAVTDLAVRIPLKRTWQRVALLRQQQEDLKRIGRHTDPLAAEVQSRLREAELELTLMEVPWRLGPLWVALRTSEQPLRMLRVFARRNAPPTVWNLQYRLKGRVLGRPARPA